jgi:hypothetical protein
MATVNENGLQARPKNNCLGLQIAGNLLMSGMACSP